MPDPGDKPIPFWAHGFDKIDNLIKKFLISLISIANINDKALNIIIAIIVR